MTTNNENINETSFAMLIAAANESEKLLNCTTTNLSTPLPQPYFSRVAHDANNNLVAFQTK